MARIKQKHQVELILRRRFGQFVRFIVFGVVFFSIPSLVWSESKAATTSWTLKNGFEVVLVHESGSPSFTVQSWYRAGSKYTDAKNVGAAYAVAALQNSGSKHLRPGARSKLIKRLGGKESFTVTEDAAVFSTTLPKEHIDLAIKLESERQENLFADKDYLKKELLALPVGRPEKSKNKVAAVTEEFVKKIFSKSSYKRPVHVSKSTLEKLKAGELFSFYRRQYVPNNGLLVVVGDFDTKDIEKSVLDAFSLKESTTQGASVKATLVGTKTFNESTDVDNGNVILLDGVRTLNLGLKGWVALQLVAEALAVGNGSILHRDLIAQDRKATFVFAKALLREDALVLLLGVGALTGKTLDEVTKRKDEILLEVYSNGLQVRDVKRAKRRLLSQLRFATATAEGKATVLGETWIRSKKVESIDTLEQAIADISNDDIKTLMKEWGGRP